MYYWGVMGYYDGFMGILLGCYGGVIGVLMWSNGDIMEVLWRCYGNIMEYYGSFIQLLWGSHHIKQNTKDALL